MILGKVNQITYSEESGSATGVEYQPTSVKEDKHQDEIINVEADQIVLTVGPWTSKILPDCPISGYEHIQSPLPHLKINLLVRMPSLLNLKQVHIRTYRQKFTPVRTRCMCVEKVIQQWLFQKQQMMLKWLNQM